MLSLHYRDFCGSISLVCRKQKERFLEAYLTHILHIVQMEWIYWILGIIWAFVPPIATFFLGRYYAERKKKRCFREILEHRTGTYTVHRKSGDIFPHMKELEITWDKNEPQALTFRHLKSQSSGSGGPKVDRTSSGTVYFNDSNFGTGFYKGDQSDYYGLANFLLFSEDEMGYYRVYVRDDKTKPNMVSTNQEISAQFILKRKK